MTAVHPVVDQLLAAARPVITDEMVERAARAMAEHDDYDGCFERIAEWEALAEWERDAHPDNHPGTDYEDAEFWRGRARAALEAVFGEGRES